jgi:hypothetical protein
MTPASIKDMTAETHQLLVVVNNARKKDWPLPLDVAIAVEPLIVAGLVSQDKRGHYVVEHVLWELHAAGRPVV